ncbi:MAG TPA: hypothetical protein VFV31_07615 [Chitinophagaceae bacterium]|nr:hypothetical protein [Chitinophagaceae bacterium]
MKKKYLFVFCAAIMPKLMIAQPSQQQRIKDSVIGWWSVLPKKATTPDNNNGYTFTVAQQENLNEIIRWMYKTYTPVAGLGTFKKNFDADLGAQKRYPPHYYGVEFRIWDVSFDKQWLTPEGKFRPIDEQYTSFYILINAIPENKPVIFVNNSDRYVFTMLPDGSGGEQLKEQRKDSDPNIHSNVYPYLKYKSNYQNIYLAPGNKLPIATVSKGELLNMAESSIETLLKTELEKVKQQFSNSKAQQDAYAYRKKDIEKYRTEIQKLRNKHINSLDQPAVVNNPEITIYSFSANTDPFEISENQREWKQYYTVHQYTKDLLTKCRTDKPQWIVISFPFITKDRGNQLTEMYKAITENFNYEYVFNYFFNPEKVKGIIYKPADEEGLKKRLNSYNRTKQK